MRERKQMVVKANELIQNSRYSLSLLEQRIVQFVISKIKPDVIDLQEITVDIQELCNLMGADATSGGNYEHFKKTLKNIRDRSVWLNLPNGDKLTFSWFSAVLISENSGKVVLAFDKLAAPFLVQLKKHYTQYQLYYTLPMKSVYSIRLYELLKSYQNLGKKKFTFDELRVRLDADTEYYSKFGVFNQKILSVALKEIAEFTDLDIEVETIRKGRLINWVEFTINDKKVSPSEYFDLVGRIDDNIGANNIKREYDHAMDASSVSM